MMKFVKWVVAFVAVVAAVGAAVYYFRLDERIAELLRGRCASCEEDPADFVDEGEVASL
ncbi:MAG: hypothetical protein IJF15_01225 [Oscillospiraceae bacterium]|nr:hypothetical protein [Oscillospiraceae bacterium]